MSDLTTQFETAVAASKTLTQRPSNDTLLQLYALFKQATQGDASGKRPGMLDPVGRAKFDAWKKLAGTDSDSAKQTYIDQIDALKAQE